MGRFGLAAGAHLPLRTRCLIRIAGGIDLVDQYYARICWNSNGWRAPSGDVANLEHQTYAAKNRFGHEEWLFNFMWVFDGYHYAFLEPVNKSLKRVNGKTIDILLWSINPNKYHVMVGAINNCQVLTDSQRREAFKLHKKAGWLKCMEQDVTLVRGNTAGLSSSGLFNVRFRLQDAIQFDDPLPVAKSTDKIAQLKRYALVAASQSTVDGQWHVRKRQGRVTVPPQGAYIRAGSQGGQVDPYHPKLQRELMKLLQERFGKDNVSRESDWVDITVASGKKKLLIEIKTDVVVKRAIREALGQILEYAYFSTNLTDPARFEDTELFIVAPGSINEEVSAYLNLLRNKFHIPIQYCSFVPNTKLPEVFRERD